MTPPNLGRLERVELRDIWTSEATEFTPWLARPENLAVLVETLGIDLELEAQERSVGPFRADILCKDIETDRWVLIENQLERITDDSFQFFGLEVELWRIGSSPATPKFNIVSKPNDWSQSVAQAARSIDDAELSETRVGQRAYWAALNPVLNATSGPVAGNRKPQPQSWMAFPIGRSGFHLGAVMLRPKNQVRTELYISGDRAKAFFGLLKGQKDAIERELGYPLEWEELPSRRDCRIASYLNAVDPEDEADWPRQHEWLTKRLNDMHRVLAQRVRGYVRCARQSA